MKKLKIPFILMFIIGTIIIIFNKQRININDNIPSNSNLNQEITASYGIEINSLNYEGDVICADITYENGPIDCEVGVVLFVNGISQPYYTDLNEEESYIIPCNLNKNTSKTIKLKFKPIVGKKDEELSIVVGSMLNPSFQSNISYGNNQKVFFLEPQTIICQNNTTNNSFSFFKDFNLNNISTKDELNNDITVSQGNGIVNRIKIENDKLKCTINLYGKDDNEYILSAYINHEIIPAFSDLYYAKVESNKEKISSVLIDFDISNLSLNDYNNFYIIAIPTQNNERAYKLDTVILEK